MGDGRAASVPRARFLVRLTPRAGIDRIDGVDAVGRLLARVRTAPIDGAANAALCRLVAETLGLPGRAVDLEAGQRARVKRLSVTGSSAADLAARWPGLAVVDAPDRSVG